jgi:hypothetical protein
MKKLTIAFISVIFLAASAQADSVGVRISTANMDASGSHTTNSTTSGALGVKLQMINRKFLNGIN